MFVGDNKNNAVIKCNEVIQCNNVLEWNDVTVRQSVIM